MHDALPIDDEKTWHFLRGFLLSKLDPGKPEQVRLFFKELKEFVDEYRNTAIDMDEFASRLLYAFGPKYEYELQIGHFIESVVRWHGSEIQGSGALENFIEKAWYDSTVKFSFLLLPGKTDSLECYLRKLSEILSRKV